MKESFMRDPLLIESWKTEIPQSQRDHYENGNLSLEELRKSANEVHDRVRRLTKTNNALATQLIKTQDELARAKQTIWVMSLIVSPIVAAIVKAIWIKVFP